MTARRKPAAKKETAGRKRASAPASAPAAAPVPAPPVASSAPVLPPEIAADLAHAASGSGADTSPWRSPVAVAGVLQEIGTLLQLTGANAFKIRAYENAARTLGGLGENLDTLLESGGLDDLPGVGSSIAEKIATLVRTGSLPYLDELRAQVPPGVLEMMKIPGLGPKKALALHDGLGLESVEALEAACREGRLGELRGFGAKTAENILQGIEQVRRVRGTFLWSVAHAIVVPVVEALRALPAVEKVEYAGSLRRRKETVHDVDLLVATADAPSVMHAFATGPWAARVLGSGETKTSVVHPSGLQMDLRAVTALQYPYALHHFTGSKEHNIAMRGRALRMGIKMNEYGLFRGEELIPCAGEPELFAAVGLAFVPPELREDRGEVEAAEAGELPARLLEPADIRGAFHVHTPLSDGRDGIEALAAAAAARGWEFLAFTDHGAASTWARGADAAAFTARRRELAALARRFPGLQFFQGIEAEIAPDGTLQLDDAACAATDFVVAAAHGAFHLSREEQTARFVRAVRDPRVAILAHPAGRILLERKACDVDWREVFAAASESGTAVEITSHPYRMDLDGLHAHMAAGQGVTLAIGLDAHDVGGLDWMEYGVGIARRGWLEPANVLNARSAAAIADFLASRRGGSAS